MMSGRRRARPTAEQRYTLGRPMRKVFQDVCAMWCCSEPNGMLISGIGIGMHARHASAERLLRQDEPDAGANAGAGRQRQDMQGKGKGGVGMWECEKGKKQTQSSSTNLDCDPSCLCLAVTAKPVTMQTN